MVKKGESIEHISPHASSAFVYNAPEWLKKDGSYLDFNESIKELKKSGN